MPKQKLGKFAKLKADPIWNAIAEQDSSSEQPLPSGQAILMLRMGGEMVWTTVAFFKTAQTELEGKPVEVPIVEALFEQLIFEKSTVAVLPDGSNLKPGFGGWLDRAMTADEPGRVVAKLDGFVSRYTVLWGNNSTIGGSASMSGNPKVLSYQNKAVFAVTVTRPTDYEFRMVNGTKSKLIST